MPIEETTLFEDHRIKITNHQATIGRHAYQISEILKAELIERKPKPNYFFIGIIGVSMAAAYYYANSLFGPLVILILSIPYLPGNIRPKPRFILSISTKEKVTQPVISLNADEIERLVKEINLAVEYSSENPPESYQLIDPEPSYTPAGTQEKFYRTVPQNCHKCDLPLSTSNIKWVDNQHGTCPRCEADVEIIWRK